MFTLTSLLLWPILLPPKIITLLLKQNSVIDFRSCYLSYRIFINSSPYYTGCGRKNSPIWEGHSFGWGAHTVVGSASSNSGVCAVFSVHNGVVGRTSSLYCWGVYKKWRVAGSNAACISWLYRVAAAFARFDPPRFFFLGLPQSKG